MYKNKLYLVESVAKHSETMEDMVVYRALYKSQEGSPVKDFQVWTRPKSMFLETTEHNGKNVSRFKVVNSPSTFKLNQEDPHTFLLA